MMLNKLCLVSSLKNNVCTLVCTVSSRPYSQEIRTFSNPDTPFLKRGTGGRSSFNGNVITVFGGTGFVGGYICNKLGKIGTQLIIPHRCDPDDYSLKRLRLAGDLGQVLFMPFDLRDPLAIRKAIKYSNVVINLIGSVTETANFDNYAVHVKGAKEIAKACKEMNVERLIHFSALNLTEKPEKYYMKKLQFLPTKLKGEEAVREEFPDATIFRPAAVFGMLDSFIWPICRPHRALHRSIPMYAAGEKTIRQPVFGADVAQAVVNAISDYSTRGNIYQAVGPERYYLKDIGIFCSQVLQRHNFTDQLIHDIKFDPVFPLKAVIQRNIIESFWVKSPRQLNFDVIEMESVTDVVDHKLPTLLDLGVTLTKLEDKVPNMILKVFMDVPDEIREYEGYLTVESLSQKAVSSFAL